VLKNEFVIVKHLRKAFVSNTNVYRYVRYSDLDFKKGWFYPQCMVQEI